MGERLEEFYTYYDNSVSHVIVCEKPLAKFVVNRYPIATQLGNITLIPEGVEIISSAEVISTVLNCLAFIEWHRREFTYSCPGLHAHLAGDEWRYFQKNLENEFRCSLSLSLLKTPAEESFEEGNFHSPDVNDENSRRYGNLLVSVYMGDITEDDCDVIINGVNSTFNLAQGCVSSAVLKEAGREMQVQCCHFPLFQSEYIRVTKGWGVMCHYVIHIVINTKQNLAERIYDALICADKMGLASVSVPAIGTGGMRIDPKEVALCMCKAFETFAMENHSNVKKINVVIFKIDMLNVFLSHIVYTDMENYGRRKALAAELRVRSSAVEIDTVVMEVISDSEEICNESKRIVMTYMEKYICKQDIYDWNLQTLDDHDCINIYESIVKSKVSVSFIKLFSRLVLFGSHENVNILSQRIRNILQQYREAEILSKFFAWTWTDPDGQFSTLPMSVSAAIERLYKVNKSEKVCVYLYGSALSIDFSTMLYQFLSTSGKVRRESKLSESECVPEEWCDMDGKSLMREELEPGSDEYNRVLEKFKKGNPWPHTIVKIERIQNPSLYKQYLIRREDVRKHLTSTNPVERQLFHGTSKEDAEKICAEGFDRAFAGKNATAYGRGSYFAVDSSYSYHYAKKDYNKTRHMFLANVLTGDYCAGDGKLKAAPEKTNMHGKVHLFDSVVDKVERPLMFVVFKDPSVYPSYLIVFK